MDLHKQYGPIASFWWGKMYTISIASAELFEAQEHLFNRHRKLMVIVLAIPRTLNLKHNDRGARCFAHPVSATYKLEPTVSDVSKFEGYLNFGRIRYFRVCTSLFHTQSIHIPWPMYGSAVAQW